MTTFDPNNFPKAAETSLKGAENGLKLPEKGPKSREFSFEWLSFLMEVQWG